MVRGDVTSEQRSAQRLHLASDLAWIVRVRDIMNRPAKTLAPRFLARAIRVACERGTRVAGRSDRGDPGPRKRNESEYASHVIGAICFAFMSACVAQPASETQEQSGNVERVNKT